MYIADKYYADFTRPEICGLSENPEPKVEGSRLSICIKTKDGRWRVSVGNLKTKKKCAEQLVNNLFSEIGHYSDIAGMTKTELRKKLKNYVFGEWD